MPMSSPEISLSGTAEIGSRLRIECTTSDADVLLTITRSGTPVSIANTPGDTVVHRYYH